MPFKKELTKQKFVDVLTTKWQSTSTIAKQVGCTRWWADQELRNIFDVVLIGNLSEWNVYNAVEIVECRKKKMGGRFGFTREWRLK